MNYHKLSKHNSILYRTQRNSRSEVPNQFQWAKVKVLAGLVPLAALRGESISLLLAVSMVTFLAFLGLWLLPHL